MMASVTSKSLLSLPVMTMNKFMVMTGKESVIFASHDHEFIQTIANHIVVVSKNGVIDRIDETYDEFLENEEVQAKVKALWAD